MTIILAVSLTLSPIGTTDIFNITHHYLRSGNIFYSHPYFKITVMIKVIAKSCCSIKKHKHYLSQSWFISA